jgi:hypothetical protein
MFVLTISLARAQEPVRGTGSVCVASRVDDPWWKVASPDATNTRGLSVKIDNRPTAPWPRVKSLRLDDLDLQDSHVLVILDANGKAVESVRFKFSSYTKADLCMSYDGYQGMQLSEATRRTPWCKCSKEQKFQNETGRRTQP